MPRILSTAEKYARDVKDKDVFRGGSCDKYKRKYLTSKKRISESKRKKREPSRFVFHCAQQWHRTKFQKGILTSLLFASRVSNDVERENIARYPPSRLCTCGKKMISTHTDRADYWLTTVEIMFRRSCLEFDSEETASLALFTARA